MNINPGDKVSWTHVGHSGRTISMSLREGTVVTVMCDTAIVKTKSKRLIELPLTKLRIHGKKSEITQFIEKARDSK